jgi:hypothetical protein
MKPARASAFLNTTGLVSPNRASVFQPKSRVCKKPARALTILRSPNTRERARGVLHSFGCHVTVGTRHPAPALDTVMLTPRRACTYSATGTPPRARVAGEAGAAATSHCSGRRAQQIDAAVLPAAAWWMPPPCRPVAACSLAAVADTSPKREGLPDARLWPANAVAARVPDACVSRCSGVHPHTRETGEVKLNYRKRQGSPGGLKARRLRHWRCPAVPAAAAAAAAGKRQHPRPRWTRGGRTGCPRSCTPRHG